MFTWSLTPQAPHRGPGRLIVLVLAAVTLVIAAVGYAVARQDPRAESIPSGRTSTSAPTRHTGSPATVDLTDTVWRDFHGVRLPYSRTNGPAETGGGRAWGFADTAAGAVLAAVHIGVRANAQWGPDIYGPTVRDQIDGPEKAALRDQLDSAYNDLADKAGVSSGAPIGRAYAVEEAFRVESFSPDAATVDIVTAGPGNDGSTVRAATRIQLTRHRHDWHVLAPPGGDWGSSAHVVDSVDGYRPFGDEQDDHEQEGS